MTSSLLPQGFDLEQEIQEGWPSLDVKQKAFAISYISTYDHRRAAEEAGYSPSRGIQLKRHPIIAAYIRHLQEEHEADILTTKQSLDVVLDYILDASLGHIAVPIVTASGEEIEARKFNGELALRTLQEKAKVAGIVKEDDKHALVQVNINMEKLVGGTPSGTVLAGCNPAPDLVESRGEPVHHAKSVPADPEEGHE